MRLTFSFFFNINRFCVRWIRKIHCWMNAVASLNQNKIFRRKQPKASTIKKAKDFLPKLLKLMESSIAFQSKKILLTWDRLLDRSYPKMTKAIGYDVKTNVLKVKVYNASLYATLSQCSQHKMIQRIREELPCANIKKIQFVLG